MAWGDVRAFGWRLAAASGAKATVKRVWLFAGCLAVAACSQQTTPSAAASGLAQGEPAPPSASAVPDRFPEPAKPMIVLDSDGIAVRSGNARPERLAYGAPRAATEALAARALGPAASRMSNDECGAGPMEFTVFTPLTLNFQDGKLVGWSVDRGDGVETSDGIAPRAKFARLQRERGARLVDDSTLEGEFEMTAGDGKAMWGFVEGTGDKAEVASLYAGTTCFFR